MSELPETSGTPASEMIAAAAQRHGAHVERLSPNVVLCRHRDLVVAFRGMAGHTSGQFAHALCKNEEALRRFLSSRGVPVVAEGETATTVEIAVVGAAVAAMTDADYEYEADPIQALAREAAAVIPGAVYCTVTVAAGSAEPRVSAIDPSMRTWATPEAGEHGRAVANAIVMLELASPA